MANSIKHTQCKYGSECRAFKRELKYGNSNNCKHNDTNHLNKFLHPYSFPWSLQLIHTLPDAEKIEHCKYGDKCDQYVRAFVGVNGCYHTDCAHIYNYRHESKKDRDYNLITSFILKGNKEKIIEMLSDPIFDVSHCPPIKNHSIFTPPSSDTHNEIKKIQHNLGYFSVIALIAKNTNDNEIFSIALDKIKSQHSDINFATVLYATRNYNRSYTEILGKDTVNKFLHYRCPIRMMDMPKSTGSMFEDNPYDCYFAYHTLIDLIINTKDEYPEVYELINGWNLISDYDTIENQTRINSNEKIIQLLNDSNFDMSLSFPLERILEHPSYSHYETEKQVIRLQHNAGFFSVTAFIAKTADIEVYQEMVKIMKKTNCKINLGMLYHAIERKNIQFINCLDQDELREIMRSEYITPILEFPNTLQHQLFLPTILADKIICEKDDYVELYDLMIELGVMNMQPKGARQTY